MIRSLILKVGTTLLDVVVVILLAAVVIGSLATIFQVGFWAGLGALVGGGIAIVVFFFMIYLIIDIREVLLRIEKAKKNA